MSYVLWLFLHSCSYRNSVNENKDAFEKNQHNATPESLTVFNNIHQTGFTVINGNLLAQKVDSKRYNGIKLSQNINI